MLPESLKRAINRLSDEQLKELALLIESGKAEAKQQSQVHLFWRHATPAERAEDFRTWARQLPETGMSLSDEACDRGSLYEE